MASRPVATVATLRPRDQLRVRDDGAVLLQVAEHGEAHLGLCPIANAVRGRHKSRTCR
jgi:hypothetical protein